MRGAMGAMRWRIALDVSLRAIVDDCKSLRKVLRLIKFCGGDEPPAEVAVAGTFPVFCSLSLDIFVLVHGISSGLLHLMGSIRVVACRVQKLYANLRFYSLLPSGMLPFNNEMRLCSGTTLLEDFEHEWKSLPAVVPLSEDFYRKLVEQFLMHCSVHQREREKEKQGARRWREKERKMLLVPQLKLENLKTHLYASILFLAFSDSFESRV
jgi:hypothetical protein